MSSEEYQREIFEKIIGDSRGVLHIGAHLGQESKLYQSSQTQVIWIEAIPEIATLLAEDLQNIPGQKVITALLGRQNLESIKLNLSSNNFESSSVYEFGSEIGFANLRMTTSIQLPMLRLDTIFTKNDLAKYQTWIIDVQGAELDVLIGAGSLLEICNVLQVEVSTREVYKGETSWIDLKDYLSSNGFIEIVTPKRSSHQDIIFIRVNT